MTYELAMNGDTMKALATALVFLGGCAHTTGADVDAARASWFGAHYDEVVSRWGTPVRSTPLSDGRLAYTWVSDGQAAGASLFPSLGVFGGSGGIGIGVGAGVSGAGGEWVRCERTLLFRDARVVEQTWQGAPNYCRTFRRG